MQSLDQNFESMSVGVTRRFDRSQKEIMAINKLLVTGGSALAALLLAATALSFFNWSSNSTFDDLIRKNGGANRFIFIFRPTISKAT